MAQKKRKKRKSRTRSKQVPAKQPSQARLSICMIVRDEQRALPGCLESIQELWDELIVVDTGSHDQTREIAQRYGANVFEFEWVDNFSAARNESLRHATGEWILWLDADDRLESRHHPAIRQLIQQPQDRVFGFVLENVGGDSASCIQARMFPNLPGVEFTMPVHEQITPSLMRLGIPQMVNTDVVVTHTGYTDPETIRAKKQKYLGIMERWLEDHPADYITRSHVALTYHTTHQPDAAIREYRKIVQESPCQVENPYMYRYALLFLGRSYIQKQDYAEALTWFDTASAAGMDPTLVHLSCGECYHALNQPEKAVEHLEYVRNHPIQRTYFPMELDTIHYAAHHFLAQDLAKLQRWDEAICEYRRAIEINPSPLEAWLGFAQLYHTRGAWAEANTLLIEALKQELKHADIYHLLGLGYLQMGQLDNALAHFRQALILQPDHASAGSNVGIVLRLQGHLEEAKQAYLDALDIRLDNLDAAINLAHLHLTLGEFAEAQRRFWQVYVTSANNLDVCLGMAWASAELEQREQVQMAWETMVQEAAMPISGHASQGNAEDFARLAQTLHQQDRPQLAQYAIRTALALKPTASLWEKLGDLSFAAQRHQDARDHYEQALLMEPQQKHLFHKLGQCYAALGVMEVARLCEAQAA